jgi:hypothetical protein
MQQAAAIQHKDAKMPKNSFTESWIRRFRTMTNLVSFRFRPSRSLSASVSEPTGQTNCMSLTRNPLPNPHKTLRPPSQSLPYSYGRPTLFPLWHSHHQITCLLVRVQGEVQVHAVQACEPQHVRAAQAVFAPPRVVECVQELRVLALLWQIGPHQRQQLRWD